MLYIRPFTDSSLDPTNRYSDSSKIVHQMSLLNVCRPFWLLTMLTDNRVNFAEGHKPFHGLYWNLMLCIVVLLEVWMLSNVLCFAEMLFPTHSEVSCKGRRCKLCALHYEVRPFKSNSMERCPPWGAICRWDTQIWSFYRSPKVYDRGRKNLAMIQAARHILLLWDQF
jgi:hypothetical protein